MLQLIQCFGDYWWEETYSIIYATLTVTAVLELLFTRGLLWRFAVQCVAAVILVIANVPFVWAGWPESWRVWKEVREFAVVHGEQLHPFIELALIPVILVHLMAIFGKNRSGAIFVIVSSIAVMATFDSFFPLELWHNIAWIVTMGLSWLVILHLNQLRARHPESWYALAQRPLDIAVPAVLIISLVLLSGVFMPRAPVLLEDPYTIWSEAQGREVPSFAGEGGVLSSTGGSSGSSQSGYSRDDRNIGGGFQFDFSPVMTVTTSERSYWRGESKAVYTGQGWGDRRNPELFPFAFGDKPSLPIVPKRANGVETKQVVQTVKILRKDKLPVLFAAGPASTLTELKSDNNSGLQWNPEEWELRWNKPAKVESYTVVSDLAVLDEAALRKSGSVTSFDPAPYLQLPDSLPERVRNLAREQTAGLTTDYDRAKKLESYLKETFPYTNAPDLSKQVSKDVVDAFLFEIKEGYCDYFSTSFVVMARSIGLPTRWVKGYATGFDPASVIDRLNPARGETPNLAGAGTYTVRNADAHSWAEVYFEGNGWIPFEPTSGFSVPQPGKEAEVVQPDTEQAADTAPVKAAEQRSNDWLVPAGVGAALLIAVVLYLIYRRGGIGDVWYRVRYYGSTPNQRVVREMDKLLSFLKRRGLRRETHETIRETFSRWSGKFSSLRSDFEGLLTTFEQVRYGHQLADDRILQEFTAAAAKIRKAL
jgi:transglutaminase-like putative cysteine protease